MTRGSIVRDWVWCHPNRAKDALRLEALRAALDPAIADMKAGRTTPVPTGRELETILALAGTISGDA
jgi:hypothetical protein